MAVLAESLRHVPFLLELDLSSNDIGPVGARALAAAFVSVPSLRKLVLDNNTGTPFGDDGVKHIAAALHCVPHLVHLSMCGLALSAPDAAAELAASLQHTPGLRILMLGNNRLRDAGAAAFIHALPPSLALTQLYLNDCSIHKDGLLALCHQLAPMQSLILLECTSSQYMVML